MQRGRTLLTMNSSNNSAVYDPCRISQVMKPSIVYAGRTENRSVPLKGLFSNGVRPIGAQPVFLSLNTVATVVVYEARCLPDTEVRRGHAVYRSSGVSRSFPGGQFLCRSTEPHRSPVAICRTALSVAFRKRPHREAGVWVTASCCCG